MEQFSRLLVHHGLYLPIIWRSQGVTIPLLSSDSAVCVHEHLETKFGAYLGTCTPVFSRPPVTQG